MHSPPQSWEMTELWRLIEDRAQSGDPAPQLLKTVMPDIETVLSKGSTAPIDFTLHDEEHAFRVAQRMFELLPDDVAEHLGSFELCLLLLSAYLHDIGMTPTRDVVKRHHRYILTKSDTLLSDGEALDLQHWLDEAQGGLELPVEERATTVAGLDKAEELLAYYCRHRHNDWSEVWIQKHLMGAKPVLYTGWIDDLVTLCRSHHEGLEALRQSRFEARSRGSPAQVVNLRYLAAVLRVADVMEFDPERTPDVIIAHRDITPKSRVYWHKDRFSFIVDRRKREFRLDAVTPDAKTHHAVVQTIEGVDHELLTCNALASSGAFSLGSFKDDRCHWPWPAKVNARVTEDGSFVYIDGAFRPEPQHILKLLGGVELYQNPIVAVRELLQNAFDAVKEQIARERLQRDEPADPAWERKLGELHSVTLSLVREDCETWLLCEDDGVGMTRSIIERHLLVSGSPPLPEVHQLEREADAYGFSVERSGQFGVGILSYFMIADRMIVATQRSDLAGGDPENTGWRFEIDGLGSFGQLMKTKRKTHGTEVRLRIRANFAAGVADFDQRLASMVQRILAYLPCMFRLVIPGRTDIIIGPGWPLNLDNYVESFVSSLQFHFYRESIEEQFIPAEEIKKREEEDARWATVKGTANTRLNLARCLEGDLPDKKGRYRIHLCHFDLDGGASLAFLDLSSSRGRLLPSFAHTSLTRSSEYHSWNGFRVRVLAGGDKIFGIASRNLIPQYISTIVEVNWTHKGQIDVSRNRLMLRQETIDNASLHIGKALERLCLDFLIETGSSKFAALNRVIVGRAFGGRELPPPNTFYSAVACADFDHGDFAWDRVKFPALEVSTRIDKPVCSAKVGRKKAEMVVPLKLPGHRRYISVFEGIACPTVKLIKSGYDLLVLPYWEKKPGDRDHSDLMFKSRFPKEWREICQVHLDLRTLWNVDNAVVKMTRREDYLWVVLNRERALLEMVDELLGTPSRAAAWVLANLNRPERFWNGLRDQVPHFFCSLMDLMVGPAGCGRSRAIYALIYDREYHGSLEAIALSRDGLLTSEGFDIVPFEGDWMKMPDGVGVKMPSRSGWRIELSGAGD